MEVGIMSVKQPIKCNCGQRIVEKDVMQTGYYLRLFGPSFVYVKFRCSRCKKLGEQFVKQDEWEDGILNDIPPEVNDTDKDRLTTMGPISIDEQIDFHFALETGDIMRDLINQVQPLVENVENTEDSKK
jgi:DNA-directed RNA polymerase subunit RPC12/RpoP